MGTRGAIGFRIDGGDKIAYNHFDSYPDGVGDDIVSFVEGTSDWDDLRARVRALRVIDGKTPPTANEIGTLAGFMDLGVGGQDVRDWYCLLRKTQGDLGAILEAGVMVDASKFMADSLFCEWAYVVNLDDMTFEVYRGFQKAKHDRGRYASEKDTEGYYPVALIEAFPLARIPNNWQKIVDPPEEEDAE